LGNIEDDSKLRSLDARLAQLASKIKENKENTVRIERQQWVLLVKGLLMISVALGLFLGVVLLTVWSCRVSRPMGLPEYAWTWCVMFWSLGATKALVKIYRAARRTFT
jgi:hypothetical protein